MAEAAHPYDLLEAMEESQNKVSRIKATGN